MATTKTIKDVLSANNSKLNGVIEPLPIRTRLSPDDQFGAADLRGPGGTIHTGNTSKDGSDQVSHITDHFQVNSLSKITTVTVAAALPTGSIDYSLNTFPDSENLLIMGGALDDVGGGPENKVFLYDMTSNSFTPKADMPFANSGHVSLKVLGQNKFIVFGGTNAAHRTETYEYNLNNDTWTPRASKIGLFNPQGVQLLDGTMLSIGGYNSNSYSMVQKYDPSANTWSTVQAMNVDRIGHRAIVLNDGKVLVVGGWAGDRVNAYVPLNSAEIYDPNADTWTLLPSMSIQRIDPSVIKLPNGNVLVVGGSTDDSKPEYAIDTAEVYNWQSQTWTKVLNTTTARGVVAPALSLVHKGQYVLVAGGAQGDSAGNPALQVSDLYDISGNRFQRTNNMKYPRSKFKSVYLPSTDRTISVFGFSTGGVARNDLEFFDFGTEQWALSTKQTTYLTGVSIDNNIQRYAGKQIPFGEDIANNGIQISDFMGTDIRFALAAMAPKSNDYIPAGKRALPTGNTFDNALKGTDSIAFGGQTHRSALLDTPKPSFSDIVNAGTAIVDPGLAVAIAGATTLRAEYTQGGSLSTGHIPVAPWYTAQSFTVTGSANTVYGIKVRFRGVVQGTNIFDSEYDGSWFARRQINQAPYTGTSFVLEVSGASNFSSLTQFVLNAKPLAIMPADVQIIDYEKTFDVAVGGTIRLFTSSSNGSILANTGSIQPSGVTAGATYVQFVQMDISQVRYVSGSLYT